MGNGDKSAEKIKKVRKRYFLWSDSPRKMSVRNQYRR